MAPKKTTKKAGGKLNGKATTSDLLDATKLTGTQLLGLKKLPTVSFPLVMDAQLAIDRDDAVKEHRLAFDAHAAAVQAAAHSKTHQGPSEAQEDRLAAATEARDAAVAAANAVTVEFVFKALPRAALIALRKLHRPTKTQDQEFRDQLRRQGKPQAPLEFNTETFPPALVLATCQTPTLDEDTVTEMWHGPVCETCNGENPAQCPDPECDGGRRRDLATWTDTELSSLFTAAMAACNALAG